MVTSSEILEIVEIIYFAPAVFVALFVCVRHGFSREAGWLSLAILSVVRAVGAALGIAATKNPSTGLITAALVLSSIGSAVLVAALTGIANRIETGSGLSHLSPKIRKYIQLIGLVAIIMGIVGGTKVADSDPDTRSDGYTFIKVSAVFILVQYLANVYLLSLSAMNMRRIIEADRRLFFAAAASCPFIFIRVVYSLCAAFDPTSSVFSTRSNSVTAVAVRAVMAIAMEIIAASFLLFGGLVAPKMQTGEVKNADAQHELLHQKGYSSDETRYQAPVGPAPRY